jgi:hypothetical protein
LELFGHERDTAVERIDTDGRSGSRQLEAAKVVSGSDTT